MPAPKNCRSRSNDEPIPFSAHHWELDRHSPIVTRTQPGTNTGIAAVRCTVCGAVSMARTLNGEIDQAWLESVPAITAERNRRIDEAAELARQSQVGTGTRVAEAGTRAGAL
jgi:hypothetical protein